MVFSTPIHQYVARDTSRIVTEQFIGDKSVSFIYNIVRENAPAMLSAITSARMSKLLSFYHYDFLDRKRKNGSALFTKLNIDWHECLHPPEYYDTPRKIFERQIRYEQVRPMDTDPDAILSPADSRILAGSLADSSCMFIKEKFFTYDELLGTNSRWKKLFRNGDYAIFRLTPDKYHYNHMPVSGRIADIYEVDGSYHSCNPLAVISIPSIYDKNKRVITIIDTDVAGGTQIGLVVMVEVVALMIGEIVQAYSEQGYDLPRSLKPGMFIKRGCPKSLYKPGSSTDILIFQPGRISFAPDLVHNSMRQDVVSRFRTDSGRPLVETDIKVRSTIAHRCQA